MNWSCGSRRLARAFRTRTQLSFTRRPPDMGKLERLRIAGLGNAAESMGAGVPGRSAPGSALHGATPLGPASVPAHLQGVSRNKDAAVIPIDKIGPDPEQPREEFNQEE